MTRMGQGYDTHRLVAGRPLILGGVSIPFERGLDGHSDADALCHAVCDALLGAMADGDIGRHFPDTDARWKGADSLDLLRRVAARVRAQGGRIANADATILAEAPRMAPHAEAMRENMARAMGVTAGQVSVKATRAEGMGAVGRGEGIAVMAVAAVEMDGEP